MWPGYRRGEQSGRPRTQPAAGCRGTKTMPSVATISQPIDPIPIPAHAYGADTIRMVPSVIHNTDTAAILHGGWESSGRGVLMGGILLPPFREPSRRDRLRQAHDALHRRGWAAVQQIEPGPHRF